MAYGMMAVEPNLDILCLGEMGIANTASASAICAGLFGGDAQDWVGPGTGVAGDALAHKKAVIDGALKLHFAEKRDPLDVLARVGGLELAAIAGAVMAARLARTPVLLDGFACTAAASVLYALDEHALDHCMVAHMSAEPGSSALARQDRQEAAVRTRHALGRRLGTRRLATWARSRRRSLAIPAWRPSPTRVWTAKRKPLVSARVGREDMGPCQVRAA